MRALLDVNVLIALLDGGHLHHGRAMRWIEAEAVHGWASCPITQNGCLRILSQPAYPNPVPVAQVAERLAEATLHPAHEFWHDAASLLEEGLIDWSHVIGHRQVTDAYLLALSVKHGGRFVTLDRRVPAGAVPGAQARHCVVLDGEA